MSEKDENEHRWFVVSDQEEADSYKDQCDNKIQGLQVMKSLCQRAVDNEFHKNIGRSLKEGLIYKGDKK